MLRIKDWSDRFEAQRERDRPRKSLDWVRVPCDLTSTGYGLLMGDANGAQHLGVFLSLLEIVAALPIVVRDGRLVNQKGMPLSVAAISVKTRIPAEKISESIAALMNCGWLIEDDELPEVSGNLRKFLEIPGGEGEGDGEGDGEAKNICASGDARAIDSLTEGEKHKASPSVKNISDEALAQFEAFWGAYWLKKARAAALKAFMKHADKVDEIMAGLEAQRDEMLAREPRHRPYAASWLNGERWADEATGSGPEVPKVDNW